MVPLDQTGKYYIIRTDLTVAHLAKHYTRKNLTTCSKSANKPLTSCVRTACYKLSTSLEQAVNNLWQACWYCQTCVTRLFQQGCYSHDTTILLQPCVVNLVTSCYIMTVSDLLEQLVTSLIMPSSLLQVVNSLFQTCFNKQCEHNLLTTCEQTCYNLFADL